MISKGLLSFLLSVDFLFSVLVPGFAEADTGAAQGKDDPSEEVENRPAVTINLTGETDKMVLRTEEGETVTDGMQIFDGDSLTIASGPEEGYLLEGNEEIRGSEESVFTASDGDSVGRYSTLYTVHDCNGDKEVTVSVIRGVLVRADDPDEGLQYPFLLPVAVHEGALVDVPVKAGFEVQAKEEATDCSYSVNSWTGELTRVYSFTAGTKDLTLTVGKSSDPTPEPIEVHYRNLDKFAVPYQRPGFVIPGDHFFVTVKKGYTVEAGDLTVGFGVGNASTSTFIVFTTEDTPEVTVTAK